MVYGKEAILDLPLVAHFYPEVADILTTFPNSHNEPISLSNPMLTEYISSCFPQIMQVSSWSHCSTQNSYHSHFQEKHHHKESRPSDVHKEYRNALWFHVLLGDACKNGEPEEWNAFRQGFDIPLGHVNSTLIPVGFRCQFTSFLAVHPFSVDSTVRFQTAGHPSLQSDTFGQANGRAAQV